MSAVHVLPLHDPVAHDVPGGLDGHENDAPAGWLVLEADPDAPEVECPCGPAVELVNESGAADGWLYVHHSLDGREARE